MRAVRTVRIFIAMLLSLVLAVCLCAPVLADDGDSGTTDSYSQDNGQSDGYSFYPGYFPGGQYPGGYPYGQYPGNYSNGQYPGNYSNGQYPGYYPNSQYPGSDSNGQYPGYYSNGQQQTAPEKTTLTSMPSARSVKSGDELTLTFDLILSNDDMSRISVIQQGTTLEYSLTYTPLTAETPAAQAPQAGDASGSEKDDSAAAAAEDESRSVTTAGETVSFSMDRENNERCTLTLRPEVTESSVLVVSARMVFADGETLDCKSDKILVYTAPEVRSHISAVACTVGDQLQADMILIGPEGQWQFVCRLSWSTDGGQTYQPSETSLISFTVNTREREPKASFRFPVSASENCFCRIESQITLPDGTVISNLSDPFMVSLEDHSQPSSSEQSL